MMTRSAFALLLCQDSESDTGLFPNRRVGKGDGDLLLAKNCGACTEWYGIQGTECMVQKKWGTGQGTGSLCGGFGVQVTEDRV